MLRRYLPIGIVAMCPLMSAVAQPLPPAPVLKESPWNGGWVLNQTRNLPEVNAAAADGYRFHLGASGEIRWEIPSLREVVLGKTDGKPMPIVRDGHPTKLTLSVTAKGPRVLEYTVQSNGKPTGGGRMTLIEQDKVWVDLTGPYNRSDLVSIVLYGRSQTK